MKVNVQYAQTHFSDLISAASKGEEVEIELPNQPALFLAPRPTPISELSVKNPGKRILGAGRGELEVPTIEEWRAMDKELEQLMNDSPIFPASVDTERR